MSVLPSAWTKAILAGANLLLALLWVSVAGFVFLVLGVLGWIAHPAYGWTAVLGGVAFVAVTGVGLGSATLHAVAAWRLWKGGSPWVQRCLACAYLALCPVGIGWASQGLHAGARGLALAYIAFFTLGCGYGLWALWAVRRG